MNTYIAGVFGASGLPDDVSAVNAARIGYLRRYGATLLGMVRHHNVQSADFLQAAHLFDNLESMLRTETGLHRSLKALPGRKILLTNAPRVYSQDVLRHFGLQKHFTQHIPIESMVVHGRLQPKPSRALLRKLLAELKTPAHRCVLVEDTLANLKAAKTLGMRTVWITGYLLNGLPSAIEMARKRPSYVDLKIQSIGQLLKTWPRLN